MEIIKDTNILIFNHLNIGDCFSYKNESFIKIKPLVLQNQNYSIPYNALNLKDFSLYHFGSHKEVKYLKSKLFLEEKEVLSEKEKFKRERSDRIRLEDEFWEYIKNNSGMECLFEESRNMYTRHGK